MRYEPRGETAPMPVGLAPGHRQKFQSHEAPKLGVFGFVNNTHPATAQLLNNAVMRDGLPDHCAEIL